MGNPEPREAIIAIAREMVDVPSSDVVRVLGAIWLGMRIQEGDPELARHIRDAVFAAPEYRGELIGHFDQWLADLAETMDQDDCS